MPLILDAAHAANVRITWHLEPYDAGRGQGTTAEIRKDIEYINSKYRKHPGCLTVGGKAVFFVYDSYRTPGGEWAKLFSRSSQNSLRHTSSDGVFLSLVVEKKHMHDVTQGGFDGFYTYFAVDRFTYGSTWDNYAGLQQFATLQGLTFIPSVAPGHGACPCPPTPTPTPTPSPAHARRSAFIRSYHTHTHHHALHMSLD